MTEAERIEVLEGRVANQQKWINAMLPLLFRIDEDIRGIEDEPANGLLRPYTVKKFSKRTLQSVEDIDDIKKQVGTLFLRMDKYETLMQTKMDKPLRINIKT